MDMAGYSWPEDVPYHSSRKQKKQLKEAVVKTTLSRLKRRGLLENNNHVWQLTQKGKEYIAKKLFRKNVDAIKKKHCLIIAFDIPETIRRKRNWLREMLVLFEFKQLQKSVWFGPAPLPHEFMEMLREGDLLQYLRFFEAKEADIIGKDFERLFR